MPIKEIFSALSILMALIAAAPYVRSIYKGETKPHMFSWLIWGIVCATGAAVQISEGAGTGSWFLAFNSIYCLMIAAASFWIGTKDIKKSDYGILILTLSAIPVWVITKTPIWSVLIIIMIDTAAYIPTIRKSWMSPDQESALSWGLSVGVFALSLLAIENYTLATYLYPATFVVMNTGFTLLLLIRRKIIRQV